MSDCKTIHQKITRVLEKKLNIILPSSNNILNEAMRYSAIAPGKCVRPMLMLAIAKTLNSNLNNVLSAATAIEIIHTYSLIHDDLPSMDNDDYRRGKLSCHKKYSEAIAILAGDSLLTFAFEILATLNISSSRRCQIISRVAKMIGYAGIAGGQMLDITFENKIVKETEIIEMMSKKTGCLFAVAAEISAILAGKSDEEINIFKNIGLNIGILFQMQDDILDEISTIEELGKSTQKDKQAGKANLVSLLGITKAKEIYNFELTLTKELIVKLPKNDYLFKYIDYLFSK
jgi:geranylgeranyl pyrophosphate synthase